MSIVTILDDTFRFKHALLVFPFIRFDLLAAFRGYDISVFFFSPLVGDNFFDENKSEKVVSNETERGKRKVTETL